MPEKKLHSSAHINLSEFVCFCFVFTRITISKAFFSYVRLKSFIHYNKNILFLVFNDNLTFNFFFSNLNPGTRFERVLKVVYTIMCNNY